ncbi:hypothetical protein AAFC00_004583 [Neodothiora populina]|uniref:PAS domain-containing protein n=1 Tax=Neodothiora populina TaxID=2781224 RepID=A0ABR3P2H6_9PEZI
MDLTFISIHDLTPEARILYSSDSIVDVLGYTPDEIVNHSTWEFFPEEELPYARKVHARGIAMDKAAVLAYCRVKDRQGHWIGCECCFTIVYDVMIVCTSVYRTGTESQKRAAEAPVIRRLFSSSPKDPRYHMLSHLSDKFRQPAKPLGNEPRAALFLNRFTRTLTIMYATGGIEDVLGIPANDMRGRSFYYCISENCLPDAVKCLENAKGNDSIAYLRFWFRDPRLDDEPQNTDDSADDSDEEMATDTSVDQDVGGGVRLRQSNATSSASNTMSTDEEMHTDQVHDSRTSSGASSSMRGTHAAIFGDARAVESSTSSLPISPEERSRSRQNDQPILDPIELEAVISCTSDGLVVCLRRARPIVPTRTQGPYENGLFAAPWAMEPVLPSVEARAQPAYTQPFAPALGPQYAHAQSPISAGGPEQHDFMQSIREQAVFAWALTGINGSLQKFGYGRPSGDAMPHDGLPIWESDPHADLSRNDSGPTNLDPKFARQYQRDRDIFGDPGLDRSRQSTSSADRSA